LCVAFALRRPDGQCYIFYEDPESDYIGAGPFNPEGNFDPTGNWSCFNAILIPETCEASAVYGAAPPATPIAPLVLKEGVMARVMWEAPESNGMEINGYEVGIL
jgi:hypothetical protein